MMLSSNNNNTAFTRRKIINLMFRASHNIYNNYEDISNDDNKQIASILNHINDIIIIIHFDFISYFEFFTSCKERDLRFAEGGAPAGPDLEFNLDGLSNPNAARISSQKCYINFVFLFCIISHT